MRQTYANLGWIGMMSLKPTPIWDTQEGGRAKSVDRVIARDLVIGRSKPTNSAPIWDTTGMTRVKPFGILVEVWGEGSGKGSGNPVIGKSGNGKVNPGVESAKSLFFGVEAGRGGWQIGGTDRTHP
jgi:hypothetical protein